MRKRNIWTNNGYKSFKIHDRRWAKLERSRPNQKEWQEVKEKENDTVQKLTSEKKIRKDINESKI